MDIAQFVIFAELNDTLEDEEDPNSQDQNKKDTSTTKIKLNI